jgi:hypothetical protein
MAKRLNPISQPKRNEIMKHLLIFFAFLAMVALLIPGMASADSVKHRDRDVNKNKCRAYTCECGIKSKCPRYRQGQNQDYGKQRHSGYRQGQTQNKGYGKRSDHGNKRYPGSGWASPKTKKFKHT